MMARWQRRDPRIPRRPLRRSTLLRGYARSSAIRAAHTPTSRPTPSSITCQASGLIAGVRNIVSLFSGGSDHLRDQVRRYGKVFRYPIGATPMVWIADGEVLSEIMRNQDRVWSTALGWRLVFDGIDPTRPYLDGPPVLDFEPHKDVRRLFQPGFSAAAMAGYIDSTFELAIPTVDSWLAARRVRLKPDVRRLFATIANRVFLGVSDPRESAILDEAMADFWRGATALTKRELLSPTWRRARRGSGSCETHCARRSPHVAAAIAPTCSVVCAAWHPILAGSTTTRW